MKKQLLLFLVLSMYSLGGFSQTTTYDFTTNATLSFGAGGFGIWNTQADITIGGVAYILTSGGNGSFTNAATGGASNSKCLRKDGSGGDAFTLQRVDGKAFQFYGITVGHQSMNSYSAFYTLPPWYTLTAGSYTYQDMTPMTAGTAWNNYTSSSIAISSGASGVTVTSVQISFQAILYYTIDNIIVNNNPLTATTSKTNVTCNGGSNGSATVTASGGAGSYTYSWSPSGGTAATATGLTAGAYTCTITDGASVSIQKSFTITQPAALTTPTITAGGATTFCAGGSVTLTSSSATGNVWSTSATTQSITVSTSGTYTVAFTNGTCTSASSTGKTVTVTPVSVGGTIGPDVTVCSGSNSGTLTLSGNTGSVVRWESSTNNFATAGTVIANTTTSQIYANIMVTTSYRAVVQNGTCASANSSSATIIVTPVSVGGTVSTGATVCSGTNSGTLTLSGNTGSVIRWESSTNNFATAGTTIANTTTSQTYTNLTATTSYRAVVQSGTCASANSVAATVTVNTCAPAAALNFDGANDYVTIPLVDALTNITHEFWFKTSVASQGLFSVTDVNPTPAGFDRDIYLTSGNLNAYVWDGGPAETITTSGANYADNNWHHVAHVVGTGGQKLYVDGVLKASGVLTASKFTWNTKVLLGYSATSPTNKYFNGSLDEVRIWNRALCMGEIQNNRLGEIATTATGLVANYHFNQGLDLGNNTAITTLTDASGNAKTGTLVNFALTGATSNWVKPGAVTSGVNVTAFTSPATPTITAGGPTTFCSGGSVTLTSSSATGNVWSTSATTQSITVSSAGTYTVAVTTNGCTSASSAGTTVTVNTKPTVVTNNPSAVCSPSTVDLTDGAVTSGSTVGLTYSYYSNAGATVALGAPAAVASSGTYYIKGETASGCSDTASVVVTVNSLVSAGMGGSISACMNSTSSISLFSLLTGEDVGGVWTETSATPASSGVNFGLGIFTPNGNVAGTYKFTYSLVGTAPCANDDEEVTIVLNRTVTAGTGNITSVCEGDFTTSISLFSLLTGADAGGVWTETSSGTPATGGVNLGSGTFTPNGNVAGTYKFKYTLSASGSCLGDEEDVAVVINAKPVLALTTPAAVCSPATVDITQVTAGITYTYFNDAGLTNTLASPSAVTTSGTYYIKGTTAASCTNSASVVVTIKPTPLATITQGANLVADQSGATYQWYQCPNTLLNGATSQSYTPTSGGDYKVDVTLNGCVATSNCINVTITSIEDTQSELSAQLVIYPNPSNGVLNIEMNKTGDVVIINQYGQTERTFKVKANMTNEVNIEGLNEGVYFIKGTNSNTQKLIIKK